MAVAALASVFGSAANNAKAQTAAPGAGTTAVYTGTAGVEGMALDSSGNVYLGFYGGLGMYKSTYSNGSYTTAAVSGSPQLYFYGVAVDSTSAVYLADSAGGGVGTGTGVWKAVGSGSTYTFTNIIPAPGFSAAGVAVDGYGNVYTNSWTGGTLYKYTLSGGVYTQHIIASGLGSLRNMAIDPNGVIYQAVMTGGTNNEGAVLVYTPSGAIATTTTYAASTLYNCTGGCAGVAVKNGVVYIGDGTQVIKETPNGSGGYTQTVASAGYGSIRGMAVDSNGNVLVADVTLDTLTKVTTTLPDFGSVNVGTASTPQSIAFVIGTGGTLGAPIVLTQGVTGQDFALGTGSTCTGSLSSGENCVVNVTFTPKYPGEHFGAVELTNSSGGVIATQLMQANGSGPEATYTPGTISTVAGTGTGGYVASQDTGTTLATSAELYNPYGIAVDSTGNLYIADYSNNRVRKVTAGTGDISTVAGTGTVCSPSTAVCGDGGSATATGADLGNPYAVAVDGAGNLYIADTNDNRIRKVTAATGNISTVAGTGAGCSSTTAACGDGGAATSANLNGPSSVAVDGAGNLYIADANNNRIRMVSAATGTISTVAGNGTSCSSPTSACGDSGSATSANLTNPNGIALDGEGNLYIADVFENRIRKVTAATGIISTVAGTGTQCSPSTATCGDGGSATASGADLAYPNAVAVDGAGNLYIADAFDHRIRKVTPTGAISTVGGTGTKCSPSTAACGDGGAATAAGVNMAYPYGVAVDGAGNLYIADDQDNRIRKISATAAPLSFATTAVGSTSSDSPKTVTVNNIGNMALTFPLPTMGTDPSISTGFNIGNSSTCPQLTTSTHTAGTLAVGASCTDLISFAPTVYGSISGQLVTTDNTLNVSPSTQSVSLSGNATDGSQIINFTVPNSPVTYGVSPITLVATGGASGNPVTFSIISGATYGSLSGTNNSVLTITGVGTIVIAANQAGNANYLAATQVTQTVVVNQASQTINFTAPTSPVTYGASPITLLATGGASGSAVTFSISSGSAYGSLSGTNNSVLTITGAGTIVIAANQLGNTNYSAAAQVTRTVVVNQASKSINFPALTSPVTVNATATLAAVASGGDPVTYTVTSGTATISGTTITYTNAGSVTIAANSAATANYLAAPTVSQTVTVSPAASAYTAPTEPVGTASATQTAYVNITTAGTLGTISVLTQGATGLDYTATGGTCAAGTAYTVGQACSVTYTFTPTHPGQRAGGITLTGAGTPMGSVYLSGTGTGPQAIFPAAATRTNLGSTSYDMLGIAVDGNGNVFYVDPDHSAVREITAASGYASVIAIGSGFSSPYGIAVDGNGNVFVGDAGKLQVYELLASSGYATVVPVGSGYGRPGQSGVAVDASGNLFVSDYAFHTVTERTAASGYSTVKTILSGLNFPTGVAVDANGNVFVADQNAKTVTEVFASSGYTTTQPVGSGYAGPNGVTVDASGNVFVADEGGGIKEVFAAGGYTTVTNPGGAVFAYSIAQNGNGNLFLGDGGGSIAQLFNMTTPPSLAFGTLNDGSSNTQSFTIGNDGNAPLTAVAPGISGLTTGVYAQVAGSGTPADCTASLSVASGATCNVSIKFAPVTPNSGAYPDTYLLSDNNLNVSPSATQTITLSGNAVQLTKTINFLQPTTPVNVTSSATLSAMASNGDPVTYSVTSGTASIVGSTITYTTVGSVTIAANSAATSSTSAAPQVTQTVLVNQIPQTINFTAPSSPVTYGVSPITLVATGGASGNAVTFSIISGPASLSGTNNSVLTVTGAGTIVVAANQAGNTNYAAATQVTQSVTVNKATLTAAIIGTPTKTYDATTVATLRPANYQLSGLVGTDSFTVTQTAGTYAAATAGTEAVTATLSLSSFITVSGSLSNYTLPTSASGSGTVLQAIASVTPNSATKTYGTADPTLTGTLSGFIASDNVTAAYSRAAGSNVGSYTISATLSPTAVLSNYNITYNTVAFTITPAIVSVIANPVSKTYGAANPALSATVAGTVNGDTLNYTLTTTATATSGVGSYPITVTLGSNPNYSVTSTNGTLTVSQATATVTANAVSKTYGAANPALSATVAGTVNGDTLNYTLTTTATATSGIGSYPITVTLGSNSNYSVTTTNGTLTVNQATATVTANPATKTYGAANPALSATVAGTVNGDTLSYTLATPATTTSDAGIYPITVTLGSNTNYNVTGINGALTVTPALQSITFTTVLPSSDTAGDSVVLSATGGASGNPVGFSVLSGPATLANDGVTLTYTGAGTVVVGADQAGSTDYAPASEITATVVVNPAAAAYNAGSVSVAQKSNVLTATLNFANGGTLGSLNFLTQGAPNLDFIGPSSNSWNRTTNRSVNDPIPVCSVGTAYSAGQICTVSYIFQPTTPGQRLGAVAAVDNNGNPMGTSLLSGLGTGPLATFPGSTAVTMVGNGFNQPYGVAVDGAGDVFVSDFGNSAVYEIVAVKGVVTSSSTVNPLGNFNTPHFLAVDGAGDVFVAGGSGVQEIVAVNGVVSSSSTVIPVGSGFNNPDGVAVDGAGDVFVADGYNGVKKIVAVNGMANSNSTVIPVGSGFTFPEGVAVDSSGDVFVADSNANTVYEIVAVNGAVSSSSTVNTVGSGFNVPQSVAVDANGDVFVGDTHSNSVKEIVAVNGVVTSSSTVNAVGSGFSNPYGVAVDGSGHVFVADFSNGATKEIDLTTAPAQAFVDTNVGSASSSNPLTVTVANAGYDPANSNPLTFSGVSTGTTNFMLDAANACTTSTSLEPGQTCALAVDFTPQVPGTPLTDAVTLADNNLNNISSMSSSQSVSLSGNGLQQTPSVAVAPATITYGTPTVALSASISFAGTVAPTGAVIFSIDGGAALPASCSGTTSPLTCTATYLSSTLGVPSHTITASIAATPGFLTGSGINTLTVAPAALTISIVGNPSKTYDTVTTATLTSANYQLTGLVGTDNFTVNQTAGSYAAAAAGTEAVTATLASSNFTVVSGSLSNYTLPASASGPGTITQANASVTPNAAMKVYGTSDPTLTGTLTGFIASDNITATYSRATGSNVGSYTISATLSPAAVLANYNITYNTAQLTITQANASVTPNAATKVYGTSDPALTGTLTGFIASDTVTATYSRAAGSNVGNYTISATLSPTAVLANYNITYNTAQFSITPATATVTANSVSKTYGAANPALTATVGGTVNGDTLSYTLTTTATASSGVGGYPITVTLGTNPNYTVTATNGTLTVNQATATVTANAASKTYGAANPALTATVGGTVNGDTLNYTLTTTATTASGVGQYPITVNLGSNPNYTVTATNGTLTVNQATATVTANAASKTYGAANPALTATVGGTVNGDTLSYTLTTTATATSGVGQYPITVNLGTNPNYTVTATNGTLTVNQANASVTPNAATKVYGTSDPALSGTLTGFLPSDNVVASYSRAAGETVGSYTISATLSPTAVLANYNITSNTAAFSITKASASVTPNAATKVYGTSDPALSGTLSGFLPADNVVASYSRATGETVGSYTISAVLSPTAVLANYNITSNTAAFSITQATPVLSWAAPSAITYGTALSAAQLNATTSVPGTLVYLPAAGVVPGAGTQTLTVSFTPTDTTDYTSASAQVMLTVNQATPVVTWNNPPSIVYGTATGVAQQTATANVPGSFFYTQPSGVVLKVGTYPLGVAFTPTDTVDYAPVSAYATLTVTQATPVVTWANPPSIVYGTGTGAAQKTATATGVGGASLPGSYFYTTPDGTIFGVGTHPLGVAFTPTDSTDYVPVSAYATITVTKATPAVTWTAPAAITYGTALSGAQLNATASVPGTFSYTPAVGTVLHAGTQTLSVTFTPTDSTDYDSVTTTVPLTVNKATPTITWPKPAAINYGTVLGSAQLNATASVPGTFVYSPAAGTLLTGGTQPLSVSFTPTDTTDYNGASATNTITVNESTVSLGVSSGTQTYETWTNFVLGPSWSGNYSTSKAPTGTVTLYDNGVAWVTLPLGPNGLAYYTSNPPLSAGVHNLTVSYSGDANYPPGLSAVVTITVLPAPVNFQASCFGALVYSQAYQCTVNLSASTTSPPVGSIQYSLDGAAPTTVAINSSGNAPFTVSTIPSAGSHTLVITYGGQGNYAAAKPITYNFTTQKGQTELQVSPSTFFVAHGSSVTLSGSATSIASGVPSGTVTFYDNGAAIGTATIAANGAVSYTVSSIAKGSHTFSASYAGDANYAAVTSGSSFVTAF